MTFVSVLQKFSLFYQSYGLYWLLYCWFILLVHLFYKNFFSGSFDIVESPINFGLYCWFICSIRIFFRVVLICPNV
jgi:hypothetical protein